MFKLHASMMVAFATSVVSPLFAQEPLPPPPAPSPPPPPPQVAPPPSPPAAPPDERVHRVRVAIDSTRPSAVIEKRAATVESAGAIVVIPTRSVETRWEPVCVTPCRVDLDRYAAYRVRSENGINGTLGFTLPQNRDSIGMKIDAGDLKAHRAGQGLIAAGTAAVIVGLSVLVSSTSFRHEDDARLAGYITGGAGILALGIGIPLAFLTQTKVVTDEKPTRDIAFLPRKVKLFGDFTLTQKGIVF